ncbi:MAG: DUF2207 domain-containing protein, partial [Tissierellia bacterium]|nr:DUF2207 domain-containing protein [Tissierellia bacterium]
MKLKKILFIALISIFLLNSAALAASNKIDEIFVDIEILKDGTGIVTQRWQTDIQEGTELFIPMENLNHMELKDFKVSDKNGPYEFKENWDSKESFDEKIQRHGILETSNGIELVFGVSQYGNNEYQIQYTLENMVQSFEDKDGFNVRFVNDQMDPAPYRVSFRIHSDGVEFNPENAKIWAFGYGGNIEFSQGDIVGRTTSEISGRNHVTVLVEMEKGVLSPAFTGNGTFQELKEEAFIGSSYSMGDSQLDQSNNDAIINSSRPSQPSPKFPYRIIDTIPIGLIGVFVSVIIGFTAAIIAIFSSTGIKNYEEVERKTPIREIPFNGKISPTFYFASLRPNYKDENSGLNLLYAYLMKWFLNKNISENYEFIKEPEHLSRLGEKEKKRNSEYKLWEFLLDGIESSEDLYGKGFEKYMEKNYTKLSHVLLLAKKEGENFALENGFLEKRSRFGLIKSRYLTRTGIDEMLKILGTEEEVLSKSKDAPLNPELLVVSTLLGLNPQLNGDEDFEDFKEYQEGYPYGTTYVPYYLF